VSSNLALPPGNEVNQTVIPVAIALLTTLVWSGKLIGPRSRWLAYALALVSAGLVAALVAIGQFWLPQIQMGLGFKGLPPIVFAIVGGRGAVPAMAITAVFLMAFGCIKLWRQKRDSEF